MLELAGLVERMSASIGTTGMIFFAMSKISDALVRIHSQISLMLWVCNWALLSKFSSLGSAFEFS